MLTCFRTVDDSEGSRLLQTATARTPSAERLVTAGVVRDRLRGLYDRSQY